MRWLLIVVLVGLVSHGGERGGPVVGEAVKPPGGLADLGLGQVLGVPDAAAGPASQAKHHQGERDPPAARVKPTTDPEGRSSASCPRSL